MKRETWVLVANSSVARVYRLEKHNLVEHALFDHPQSRLHNRDLVSDKPGRDFESVGSARHAMEPRHSPKDVEADLFAKELARFLEAGRNRGEYDRLFVALSPAMLGLLRNNLDSATAKLISEEVDKDITQLKTDEILKHFHVFSEK